jgi:hypothetical protein
MRNEKLKMKKYNFISHSPIAFKLFHFSFLIFNS